MVLRQTDPPSALTGRKERNLEPGWRPLGTSRPIGRRAFLYFALAATRAGADPGAKTGRPIRAPGPSRCDGRKLTDP